ncbi:replicative DNA helicase [Candidatus Synechococcus calcipolaris G9]|uniref:Replicative DNA helicase n=1 Tax=Candidatus Synechococcus calcipolaris G9 TaxID=1497997 RepID=A0ABT6EVX9_9SYNE|nr:replicative DNA helicase [Candidatus Synechococcus calcipolaris]MDG2989910.1 replicative DNA helicase [Candidatus Synechococcus calcipolaris G9]
MVQEPSFRPDVASLPPQNLEAEESILGGILLDGEAIARVADILPVDAFYLSSHRDIYRATLALHGRGSPTDILCVTAWLQDQGLLDKIGGQNKLAELVDRTVSAVNIDRYALLIKDKYLRRKLIEVGSNVVQMAYDASTSLDTVLDQAEQQIFSVTQDRVQQGLTATEEILTRAFTELEQRAIGNIQPGLSCNFYDLDNLTQGFQRSDLIIIAGRPSMGKTAISLQIARRIAEIHHLGVAVFSLEMSKEQLVQRLLASEARIDSNYLRAGRINQHQWEPLSRAIGVLSQLPIYIDDTANPSLGEIRSNARRLQAEHPQGLGLILIDYLQLMGSDDGTEGRVQELSKITRSLKGLARELNVPIVALSQLSRGVEARQNKRPLMSDLRESGCLTGDTLIPLADNGQIVPLKSLVGQSGFKVWSLNQTTGKLVPAIVSHAFATGIKPVWQLTTQLGRTIKATANHPFLTIHGWQRLDQLKVGTYIALPRKISIGQNTSLEHTRLALLGHLIGDGCTLPRHSIQYTTKELELAEEVVRLVSYSFKHQINPRIAPERNWYQVYLAADKHLTHGQRNPIAAWLDELELFGKRSHEKFIPRSVFNQPKDSIALFLKHLWATDGCIHHKSDRHPQIFYATSSYQLARDVQSLLLRFEINAILRSVSQGSKGRCQFHVLISGKQDLERFIHEIGALGSRRQQALQNINHQISSCQSNTNRDIVPKDVWQLYVKPAMQKTGTTERQLQSSLGISYCGTSLYRSNLSRERCQKVADVLNSESLAQLANSDIYWDKIKEIEFIGEIEVYDLTVPKHHNFVANNIIVHNSIEQDADLVILLYRDEYYNPDTPDRGICELILAKHRNGPVGTVKLLFDPQYTRFENLAQQN